MLTEISHQIIEKKTRKLVDMYFRPSKFSKKRILTY